MILYDDYNTDWEYIEELAKETDEDIYEYLNFYNDEMWSDCKENLKQLAKNHNKFIMVGSCGTWCGREEGGVVLHDLMNFTNYLHDYTIIELNNGVLDITTIHHDGTNYYHIRPLTERGVEYYHNHFIEMTREEMCKKLNDTKCLRTKFKEIR